MKEVPANLKKLKGIPLRLDQINWIVDLYDQLKPKEESGEIDNAMAVAKAQFMKSHIIRNGRWVKKASEDAFGTEPTEGIVVENMAFSDCEATFEHDDRMATFTVIKPGWSKNKHYYSEEVVESIVPMLLERRKMYLDHGYPTNVPRSVTDWVATIEDAWFENGNALAKAHIFEQGKAGELYEKASKYPSEVGVSIVAIVKAKKGKVDGQSGLIIEQVLRLRSADFVLEPAAGGEVHGVTEEVIDDMNADEIYSFDEFVEDLDEKIKQREKRDAWWNLWSAFSEALREIIASKESKKAKKEAIGELMDDFKTRILRLDLDAIYDGVYYDLSSLGDEDFNAIYEKLAEIEDATVATEEGKEVEEAVEFSDRDWGSVKKSELPRSCFLIQGDPDHPTTWKLPVREPDYSSPKSKKWPNKYTKAGPYNRQAIRAAIAAVKGARTGKPMTGVTKEVWQKLLRLAKRAGIESKFLKEAIELYAGDNKELAQELEQAVFGKQITPEEVQQWLELHPDFNDELKKTIRAEVEAAVSEEVEGLRTKLAEATKQLEDQQKAKEAEEYRAFVDEMIERVQAKVSEEFRNYLYELSDKEKAEFLIREHARTATGSLKDNESASDGDGKMTLDEEFILKAFGKKVE